MQLVEIQSSPPVVHPETIRHYRRPAELPFTADERDKVTILIGGLTWKHEELIRAVFENAGYRCKRLPVPMRADFEAGKQYGNNGQCNPTYFTVGCLVRFLQHLEESGLSRRQIARDFVFFSAGSCGPCRFGMYEAEYRYALSNAGFPDFRVLIFQQGEGIHANSGQSGLSFSLDFGLNGLNALMLGDVISDMSYRIRPFEKNVGQTDRVVESAISRMTSLLLSRGKAKPGPSRRNRPHSIPQDALFGRSAIARKMAYHLYGRDLLDAIAELREAIDAVPVDRLRVKPVVKVTGEFWAQLTEGDGNFQMFNFLEQEGAQVLVEPISTWVAYLLRLEWAMRRERSRGRRSRSMRERIRAGAAKWREQFLFDASQWLWARTFNRVARRAGSLTPALLDQSKLAEMAAPFFHELAQGGEGHMEVAKSIYYSENKLCHMVLGLKPFGCMPSTQSDAVQARVVSAFPQMLYLPVETSGEGAIHAYSRVQMVLSEARARARAEFDNLLRETGRSMQELRDYVSHHHELERPLYRFPRRPGIAGEAAQFTWHLHTRMNREGIRAIEQDTASAAEVSA
ncbi:MAG: hypothetical protein ACLPZY_10720 [Terracidiphilus sp.]